jgi:mono/diheme cytochrome c family protein
MKALRVSLFVVVAGLLAGTAAMGAQAPQGDATRGKATFLRVGCWSCHGYEGQGAATGPKLAPGPRAWPAFSTFVRTTSGVMPPYTEKVVSTQDLADIHAYLASIPASPAPASIPVLQQLGN